MITSETGVAPLVITRDKVYVVVHVMDDPRIFDEELQGLDFEPVLLRWYEAGREQKALQLVKGLKVISDIPLEGTKKAGLHANITRMVYFGDKLPEDIERKYDVASRGCCFHKPGL